MVFCGDIALPCSGLSIDMPEELNKKQWVANLEGSLIEEPEVKAYIGQQKVFNSLSAIKDLCKALNIRVFSMANNHIADCTPIEDTIKYVDELGIAHIGAGRHLDDATKPFRLEGKTLLSFGWDVIKCPLVTDRSSGVNPYIREHVLRVVRKAVNEGDKVICIFHWGYELETYPLPYDRSMAHELIDMGVQAIIGCHAHRVQQIEFYNGKPIVYGLGNFLFPHNTYWNGRLRFPDFTRKELAFEITDSDDYITHWFDFDKERNRLVYERSERISQANNSFYGNAEYTEMTAPDYDCFFAHHRHHKKLIPIFKSNESSLSYNAKRVYVKWRGKVIDLLVKMNLKAR